MPMMTMERNNRLHEDDEELDEQSFAAVSARQEKPKSARERHHVPLISLENLPQYAKNRYEGVLIASARARQLNAKKVALEERGSEEAADLKRMKMTTHALGELVNGKIEVTRPGDSFPS